MFLSTTLFVLLVVCLMVLVNCLLNAFAICLCVVAVLLLKEIVLCVWVGFLLPGDMCVRVLFVIPSFVLCCCMREVISRFSFSVGSHELLVCLSVIFCLMCSGKSLHVLCILPFGMWSLSAYRIMLVRVLFAVCEFVGFESCFCVFRVLFPICFLIISVCVFLLV